MSSPEHPDKDPLEAHLRTDLEPRRDLAEGVFARLHARPPPPQVDGGVDEWLEEQLASWPIEPAGDFLERTLERVYAQPAHTSNPWRTMAALASGLAACLALVLVPVDSPTTTPHLAGPRSAVALRNESPAVPVPSVDPATEPSLDAEATRILALARALDQPARWLLADPQLVTFAAAVE